MKVVLSTVRNGGVPHTLGTSRVGPGVAINPNEIFPSGKVKRNLGPTDNSNPHTRIAA